MMENTIKIRGARQHNLKNINLDIPKNKLVVFTGVSGSGKSSLAFDTIYAEGQRRYVESLSTYARQFLGIMKKPDVDLIEGLSPAISIDQKTVSHNPRSTVGTVTEIYDYFRLLFARIGHPHCPICGREIQSQSAEQITEGITKIIYQKAKENKQVRFLILSPVVKDRKGEFSTLFENLKSKGYKKVRVDKIIKDLDEDFVLLKTNKHTIEVQIDKISFSDKDIKDNLFEKQLKQRITDAVEQSLKLSDGELKLALILDSGFEIPEFPKNFEDHLFSEKFACPIDNISISDIEPRNFSFNSPHGACEACSGIGKILKINVDNIFAPMLSLKEGGIIPYATIFEHDTWFSRLILTVCEKNNIDVSTPISNWTDKQKELILYGTGEKIYKVNGFNKKGSISTVHWPFHGIVNELERHHKETESDYIRNGIEKYMIEKPCETCKGARLKKEALSVTIDNLNISEVSNLTINEAKSWIEKIKNTNNLLSNRESEIANMILKEIETRLSFLIDVGLDYLTISRSAGTLSGGEAQRIRLASQIGSGLTGVLYVLDEPTIGLHPKDGEKLIKTLKKLRDLGNSVIVVEHDQEVMESADYIFDFGPKAGKFGGVVTAQGTLNELKKDPNSLTGKYLSGKNKIKFNKTNSESKGEIILKGASQFNLKNVTAKFPLGKLIAVTGVSGSGKSTLIVETLYEALQQKLNRNYRGTPGIFDEILGHELVDKVVLIDQSPIGRTPRSNPATYTKVFDPIRDVFTATREAKALGFKKGRFSFNVKGGRCEACEGQGMVKIEMQFMPDIWIECEVCHGKRYNSQTLDVVYKGKTIADILSMNINEALEFFHVFNNITQKLETLSAVGLDYMELGQSATTLSGGEAQRVKLATELSKKATGKTVYILDEPTTGLHFYDLEKLIAVLKILVDRGNTVIVVEHNLDVIKNADWIIDLGPEGGVKGGEIIAEGTPKDVSNSKISYTASYIK